MTTSGYTCTCEVCGVQFNWWNRRTRCDKHPAKPRYIWSWRLETWCLQAECMEFAKRGFPAVFKP